MGAHDDPVEGDPQRRYIALAVEDLERQREERRRAAAAASHAADAREPLEARRRDLSAMEPDAAGDGAICLLLSVWGPGQVSAPAEYPVAFGTRRELTRWLELTAVLRSLGATVGVFPRGPGSEVRVVEHIRDLDPGTGRQLFLTESFVAAAVGIAVRPAATKD